MSAKYRREVSFLFLSTALLFPSVFGRTPFISAFKPYLTHTLSLSETWISFAYTLGTLFASFLVPIIVLHLGETFRLQSGFRLIYALFISGFVCFFCVLKLKTNVGLCFIFICLGYIGLRLCGQGLLPTMVKTYTAFGHNDHQCAWIATVHTSCVILMSGLSLYILSIYNAFMHWPVVISIQVITLICIFCMVPASLPKIQSLSIPTIKQFRLICHGFPRLFKWGIAVIALQNLQATAMAFHLSDFAQEQAIPLSTIFKIFLPISIGELLLNPCISFLYTRCSVFILLQIVLWNLILINFSLVHFHSNWAIWTFIFGTALGWSLNHILLYSLPVHVLPRDQQSIGYAHFTSWVCICSACGPLLYSLIVYLGATYISIGHGMSIFTLIYTIACFIALRKTS